MTSMDTATTTAHTWLWKGKISSACVMLYVHNLFQQLLKCRAVGAQQLQVLEYHTIALRIELNIMLQMHVGLLWSQYLMHMCSCDKGLGLCIGLDDMEAWKKCRVPTLPGNFFKVLESFRKASRLLKVMVSYRGFFKVLEIGSVAVECLQHIYICLRVC